MVELETNKSNPIDSLLPFLHLIQLEGEEYSLEKRTMKNDLIVGYKPFEPLFTLNPPLQSTWMTARQVSKSTSICCKGLLMASLIPNFGMLYVLPEQDHAQELAYTRMNPIIANSPFFSDYMFSGPECRSTFLYKKLRNDSLIRQAYVLTNPRRARGPSADILQVDESQNLTEDKLRVAEGCLRASKYEIKEFTGTPLSTGNPHVQRYHNGSQGVWATKCMACNYWNLAHVDHDMLQMIGKETVVCADCGQPIDPHENGRWVHAYPDKLATHRSFLVPDIVLPIHYANRRKWQILREQMNEWSKSRFYNITLGTPCDTGSKAITRGDIRKASQVLPEAPDLDEAIAHKHKYEYRVCGIDWGGKGGSSGSGEGGSRTAIVVVGKRTDQLRFDIMYHKIFTLNTDTEVEVAAGDKIFSKLSCGILTHDLLAGPAYEPLLMQQPHISPKVVRGVEYCPIKPTDNMVRRRTSDSRPLGYFQFDRTRTMLMMFSGVKKGKLMFPKFGSAPELVNDVLAPEENYTKRRGSEVLKFECPDNKSDDAAHALNFAFNTSIYWASQETGSNMFKALLGGSDKLSDMVEL